MMICMHKDSVFLLGTYTTVQSRCNKIAYLSMKVLFVGGLYFSRAIV